MTRERIGGTRATRWLIDELPHAAVSWLPTVRWYGGKSRPIASVAIEDVVWLSGEPREAALVVLNVSSGDDTAGLSLRHDRYAAVVAFVSEPGNRPLIGTLPGSPPAHAIEATADPQFAVALLRGLATSATMQGLHGGELLYADAADRVRLMLADGGDALPIVPMGSEQSNTSVRVGSAHVFKLFRRLEAGEHPQLEFGRFLTRVGFPAAAPLEGSLAYRSADGHVHALGALEGWIVRSGDGWTHLTAQIGLGDHAGHRDVIARQMQALGETTAALHVALASDATTPAFAPEPVTERDVAEWQTDLVRQADRTRMLVERLHHRWTRHDADVARRFLGLLGETRQQLFGGRRFDRGFDKIRIHGDYHLGQTLKTAGGFALIDFEGEPTKPLAERRLKHCALKDVASMLRSLDYAWAVSSRGRNEDPLRVTPTTAPGLEVARAAFIEGYNSRARRDSAIFLPPVHDAPRWTALFELEKALYEVEYEVNNRPSWVGIPLGAAVQLLLDWQRA